MSSITAARSSSAGMTSEQRMVIFASSLGTVFEWYDFYIYGTLGVFLAKYFFSNVPANVGFIFALLAFAAGFAVRPFGALFFGRLGDMIGRKYTFLITMSLMGVGTFFIGLLPSYASLGIAAPILLIAFRLIQGLALGGEYGGAAIYVAEHAPANKRGYYTSWIQTTATLGLFMALLLVLGIRTAMGETAFGEWGWRIPFLLSAVLLVVSVWIRLKLNESPLFKKMVQEGKQSKRPLGEAFGEWKNAKIAILALLGATAGEAVVWYGGQFYALFFMTQTIKVAAVPASIMIALGLLIGTPCFILFGWLSDKIGRKPIMLAGFALAVITYFPIFQGITHYANPKLEHALAAAPVIVTADPAECSFQFKATGTEKYTTGCDIIKAALVGLSVNYQNVAAPAGTPASVKIGRSASRRLGGGRSRGHRRRRQGAWLSGQRRSGGHQLSDDGAPARHPGRLRDHGVRADRRLARGTVPDPHPLHRPVAALSYRQRLVRRLPAGHRVRHRGGHRQHLLRPLVSDLRGGDELRRGADLPARDQGSRHHHHLNGRRAPHTRRRLQTRRPALSVRGVFLWASVLRRPKPGLWRVAYADSCQAEPD